MVIGEALPTLPLYEHRKERNNIKVIEGSHSTKCSEQ